MPPRIVAFLDMFNMTPDLMYKVAVRYVPGGKLTWHGRWWREKAEEQSSMVDWIATVS